MSEFIKLNRRGKEQSGTIHLKKRQVSCFEEAGWNGCRTISMMGGGMYEVEESIDEIKELLGIESSTR